MGEWGVRGEVEADGGPGRGQGVLREKVRPDLGRRLLVAVLRAYHSGWGSVGLGFVSDLICS